MNIMDKINEFAFDAKEVAKISDDQQLYLSDDNVVEAIRLIYKNRIMPEATANQYTCMINKSTLEGWLSAKLSVGDFKKLISIIEARGFRVELYADDSQISIYWNKQEETQGGIKVKRKWFQWK